MSAIDPAGSEDVSSALYIEIDKASYSEETPLTYQVIEQNSDPKRIVQEELLLTVTSPHLKAITDTHPRSCNESLILYYFDTLFELYLHSEDDDLTDFATLIASLDPSRAKQIVDKMQDKGYRAHTLLEISKFENDENAKKTLQKVKELTLKLCPFNYSHHITWLTPFKKSEIILSQIHILAAILEEEKRREFPEAKETLARLLYQSKNKKYYDQSDQICLIKIKEKYGIPGFIEEAQHLNETTDKNSDNLVLLDLLEYQATRQLPEALITREKLHLHLKDLKDNLEKAELYKELINIEAQFPYLRHQLKEDFDQVLKLGNSWIENVPLQSDDIDDREEYDFVFFSIYKTALEAGLDQAQEVLSFIHSKLFLIASMMWHLKIVDDFSKEKENELKEKINSCDSPKNMWLLNYWMYELLMDKDESSRAKPYLEQTKKINTQFEDDLRKEALKTILYFELKYKAPTFINTLQDLK